MTSETAPFFGNFLFLYYYESIEVKDLQNKILILKNIRLRNMFYFTDDLMATIYRRIFELNFRYIYIYIARTIITQ